MRSQIVSNSYRRQDGSYIALTRPFWLSINGDKHFNVSTNGVTVTIGNKIVTAVYWLDDTKQKLDLKVPPQIMTR